MSFIGATGYNENQEELDTLKDNIDANSSYINNLVGIPDPLHTAIFGINLLNPGLFGLVERAEVNIKALQTGLEGEGTTISGIETTISGIETEVSGIQTEILGIQGEITGIDSTISSIEFVQLPALGVLIGTADGIAVDARNKANRALDIWDYSGDNVYHKKSGNVGIGNTFGSTITNKLEVQGNINIPTGSTFRIGDEPFNYTHLAGEQPVSSKWTNATDVDTNIYYNSGNVGIGITTAINNKIEIGGNLNISAGSKYKINNVNLAFSDLGGTLSYNSLSEKLTAGTNINIIDNVINNTYELPKATTNAIGGVRPDGTTITINTSTGVISSAGGTAQVNSDWTQTNTSLKSFIQNKPTAGTNISLANNTITNLITGSPTQNIITLNDNYLIVKDKPDSQIVTQVDVPLTSGNEPTITSPAFTESIRTFTHSGGTEEQTTHTITIGQNTICDILIVGGGGAGGTYIGGGGGGGGVLYITNCTIPVGTYNIQVGKGGTGVIGGASGTTAQNGSSSKAFGIEVFGGGYGGTGGWATNTTGQAGSNGGSGGGGGSTAVGVVGIGGTVIQPSFTSSVITVNNYNYYGGNGASGMFYNGSAGTACGANGGGGAGGNAPDNTDQGNAGAGADGISINILGTSYFWGGGGGGGQYFGGKAGNGGKGGGGGGSGSQVTEAVGIGGIGGITLGQDGDLEGDGTPTAGNGGPGTGGGGGGCGRTTGTPNAVSGSGGSGIVIIKFKSTTLILEGNPITHKTLNFVYDNKLLRYDFTNQNTEATWKAYASTIPNFTYSLDSFLTTFDSDAVWTGNSVVGWVQMTLPSTHNFLSITYGLGSQGVEDVRLLINGVLKSSATTTNRTITYSQAYNVGDVVRIEETFSTMSANFIFQFTNTNPNQYTLSVQQGTNIQVNNQPAQYLSGNYTISVGATQSSVLISGFSPIGQTDPYPLQNGSTIAIRYSMLQRITSIVNYKKDGLIKYVPASTTNPTTGSWNIIDIDTQPLTQFAGNLPASRLDNIDMSKVATGNLDWSRIASQPALSSLSGNLPLSRTDGNLPASRLDNIDMGKVSSGNLNYSRVDNFYLGINDRFHRIVYATENIINGGIWTNKFRINTNLHLNQYNQAYNYFQYYLSISPNNVADRHKYWFGVVKMSNLVGTDPTPITRSSSILSNSSLDFEIRETDSSSGVWWLNIWVYTSAYCESIILIMR